VSLRGDKAYFSRGHRDLLRSRGIKAVIPEPADQVANRKHKGEADGRPVGLDVEDYKQRNVVERFFNRLKSWRGIAGSYDKLATGFRGSVILAAIVDWLR
jgi:transposase